MKALTRLVNPIYLLRALRNSSQGLHWVIRSERAFQQEILAFIAATVVALILGDTASDRALMIFSVSLVLILELVNSAIESVTDRVGAERHELSGRAKDLASAAVLLGILNAIAIWAVVLIY